MKPDPTSGLVWQQVVWPRPLEPNLAVQLLRQWAADQRLGLLALEVRATKTSTCYLVGTHPTAGANLTASIKNLVPGALLSHEVVRTPVQRGARLRISTAHRALRTNAPEEITRAVLSALAAVRDRDEELVLQLLLGPRRRPQVISNNSSSAVVMPWWRAAWSGTSTPLDGERRTALRNKVSEPGFVLTLRLGVRAVHPDRQRSLLFGVLAGLRTAQASGIALRLQPERPARLNEVNPPWFWPLRLNVSELLSLTGWPLGDDPLPGMPSKHPRQLPPHPAIQGHNRILALSTAPGPTRELGLAVPDALQHLHLLGRTGTGKSTIMLNLILSDITAGRGAIVIDPKHDLVDAVLARVPASRIDDIVVLDAADEAPVGINPLRGPIKDAALRADGILAVFRSLYADSWGPRTDDILHACLLTLSSRDDTALTYLPLLLTNPGFRRSITGRLTDPLGLGSFWSWYEALSDAERQQAIAPVMNKLRAFLLRPALRTVIGQVQPKFNVSDVFTDNKVLLVSLAKGKLGGETAALLGSLVVAQAWQATLARANIPAAQRRPVLLAIDEVQEYLRLPTDLSDALATARSYGTALVMANQFMVQFSPAMRSAVMANARSRVCFNLSPEDATAMARLHPQLEPEDFQALGRYEVYASLLVDGQATPFVSGRTLAPIEPIRDPAVLRRMVRERYGRSLSDVEAELIALAEGGPAQGSQTLGRRPRRTS